MVSDQRLQDCRAHIDSLLNIKGHAGLRKTSYPSRSLNFLGRQEVHPFHQKLPRNESDALTDEQAKVLLDIIIVGAGLGGLATSIALRRRGHKVTVFEKAEKLDEVGAGIQIPPNSSRLLLKWGLGPYLTPKAHEPTAIKMRRWQDGSIIGLTQLVPDFQDLFHAPYFVVHRGNLQLAMYQRALDLGVDVRVNKGVGGYELDGEVGTKAGVVLEDGSVHYADLIVAADGVKSEARKVVFGGEDQAPRRTGFAAYRAMVDTEEMRKHPQVSWLLENPGQNLWLGEMRHVMTYTVAGGSAFNMVLSHPEDSDPSTWNQDTAIQEMKQHFAGWDPRLTKIINMIKSTLKWPLLSGEPLSTWLHPSSKLVIIGDAAHAMVPYMSSGAAMAVEDGAALAEILCLITSPQDLPRALKVFERVRILRAGQIQEASLVNGKIWHFADGAEQRARDESMREEVAGRMGEESANQWSDRVTMEWVYGYDAEREVAVAWEDDAREKPRP
ncbi:FAD/NAD(P)-binding domain-containing protein [Lindgomyces ingoldianus]|uniref:FAD/NAD(P)-binding domain-containing protein n=1 Tax=Lindgomyces ingoldianus TaxID=673940 RepID=A0ACB6RC85_9PLEO|nr:FAD/NAD(P)-binding domain-containing protein [Lindgomyces ingoldianus]KAF2476791.1 FAD/NAD(P)-binding domain-containing protein [Lindgomyces ingoldianus]